MSTAVIKGTLPEAPPAGGSSVVTVVETAADGTVLAPATYTIASPDLTFSFSCGLGSTLNASQVNVGANGFQSASVATPPFLVVDPTPAAPSGGIAFEIVSITQ